MFQKNMLSYLQGNDIKFHSSPNIKAITGCTKTEWMMNKVGNIHRGRSWFNVLDVQYTKKMVLIFKSVKAEVTN
jgi:hypothetical protein